MADETAQSSVPVTPGMAPSKRCMQGSLTVVRFNLPYTSGHTILCPDRGQSRPQLLPILLYNSQLSGFTTHQEEVDRELSLHWSSAARQVDLAPPAPAGLTHAAPAQHTGCLPARALDLYGCLEAHRAALACPLLQGCEAAARLPALLLRCLHTGG